MNKSTCRTLVVLVMAVGIFFILQDASAQTRDLMSDTWVATDQIDRVLSTHTETGPLREDRFVAIFYFLWMGHHPMLGPHDMTRIREENPGNPQWGPLHSFHWWGEPEVGYYLSADEYVIRRHIHMLTDAGVDALFFDVTNAVLYTNEYMTLLKVMDEIREEGGKTPKIAFFSHLAIIQDIYEELYKPGLYSHHWFYWDGKPLMIRVSSGAMPDPPPYNQEVASFFTFRNMWGLRRITEPNTWSFLQLYPQDPGYNTEGVLEFMSVSTAQQETYMSYPTAHGKSYHDGRQPPEADWDFQGHNFAEQFERALSHDPRLIFITGWNEWVAQRFEDEQGNTRFVDCWSIEFNRDIEPMKDGYTDTQYYQMVDLIRRYKGAREIPDAQQLYAINLEAGFEQWDEVEPTFYDHVNDVVHRNNPGWNNVGPYINNTGRNDFTTLKVAMDNQQVFFYAECADDITPHTDANWMLLFINIDRNADTGWHGYNYAVNRNVLDEERTMLQRTAQGWNWEDVGEVRYVVEDNKLMLRIPRNLLPELEASFEFKWADNIQAENDIMQFSLSGDAAPNRRFNYLFQINPELLAGQYPMELEGLLRVVQFYNAGAYYCDAMTDDGYTTLAGDQTTCALHPADTRAPSWHISMPELLRWIQFYNYGGYHICVDMEPPTEDGFCPGI